jgi:hypothetical protein
VRKKNEKGIRNDMPGLAHCTLHTLTALCSLRPSAPLPPMGPLHQRLPLRSFALVEDLTLMERFLWTLDLAGRRSAPSHIGYGPSG